MAQSYDELLRTFTQEQMFNRWSSGKVFSLESPGQSGQFLHQHDYYQFWYVEHGSCEHLIEGQKHEMYAGDAFILPPNLMHRTILRDDSRIFCCEFSLEDILSGAEKSYFRKLGEITKGMSFTMLFENELYGAREKFSFSLATQRKIEQVFTRMLDEYEQQPLLYEDFLQLHIMELLLLFIREYAQNPRLAKENDPYELYQSIINEAIAYIDENYDQVLTLDDMCTLFALSKTYFCYLFKMATRMTFVEYLLSKRIMHAKELLSTSNRTITDISQSVGFQDPSHFSRTFKKHQGLSPSEYRKYRQAG